MNENELSASTVRWAGLAGMLGGALFVVSAVVISSMPRGCIADACAARPMRETGAAGALLMLALLLAVVGMAGLVIRARHAGRYGTLGKTGAVVAAVGSALPAIGGLVQGLLYGGDYLLMPLFVIPGALALVVGFVLLGIAVLRAGVLPRWAAVFLVMGPARRWSRCASLARAYGPARRGSRDRGIAGHGVRSLARVCWRALADRRSGWLAPRRRLLARAGRRAPLGASRRSYEKKKARAAIR